MNAKEYQRLKEDIKILKWREGKLPNGDYYIKVRGNLSKKDFFTYDNCINGKWAFTDDGNIIDIIASVPSYDEYNKLVSKTEQLEKQLEIATKALEYYTLEDAFVSCYGNPVNPNPMVARKALKEMEGVK